MTGWRVLGDWGSTRLRLWRLRDGTVEAKRQGPGIVGLGDPTAALRQALADWGVPERITLCGMAGARGGLQEAPYAECPLGSAEWTSAAARSEFAGTPLLIGAGCATSRGGDGGDEVMRGEETQIFGAIVLEPELRSGRHVIVLPGTHSKWAWLGNGRIIGFRTFITGELFAALRGSSLAAPGEETGAEDALGFAAGVARARAGRGVLGALFAARTARLRLDRSADWSRDYLSGLLIAGEAAEMRADQHLPERVWLIGDAALTTRYARVLANFGCATRELSGEGCALAGLRVLDADD